MVGVNISFLRSLNIAQSNGGVLIIVERRQQSRLYADMDILHLRSVKTEIVPAQGANSDKFHLPLEDVDEHRQLVNPGFTKEFAPAVNPVVVRELTSIL